MRLVKHESLTIQSQKWQTNTSVDSYRFYKRKSIGSFYSKNNKKGQPKRRIQLFIYFTSFVSFVDFLPFDSYIYAQKNGNSHDRFRSLQFHCFKNSILLYLLVKLFILQNKKNYRHVCSQKICSDFEKNIIRYINWDIERAANSVFWSWKRLKKKFEFCS